MHDGSMSERIRFIDALRGISLAGIVMAHFGEQYLGFMPPPGRPYNIHGMADGVLEALSWIFVRGKGFGIFSFMFGLSFALQMQRADRRAARDRLPPPLRLAASHPLRDWLAARPPLQR